MIKIQYIQDLFQGLYTQPEFEPADAECPSCMMTCPEDEFYGCSAGHRVCKDCTLRLVDIHFREATNLRKMVCFEGKCGKTISPPRELLSKEQRRLHDRQLVVRQFGEEQVDACKACPAYKLKSSDKAQYHFECHECEANHCTVCDLPLPNKDEIEGHLSNCSSLKTYYDKYLECAQILFGRLCPGGCGTLGQKDSACNHITCPTCQIEWCYCCGKANEHLEKENNGSSVYDHFIKWEHNLNRCPQNLQNIHNLEPNWPTCGEKSVEVLHQRVACINLQEFIKEHGEETYQLLWEGFANVRDTGLTLEMIKNVCPTIYKRKSPPQPSYDDPARLQQRQQEEDEEEDELDLGGLFGDDDDEY